MPYRKSTRSRRSTGMRRRRPVYRRSRGLMRRPRVPRSRFSISKPYFYKQTLGASAIPGISWTTAGTMPTTISGNDYIYQIMQNPMPSVNNGIFTGYFYFRLADLPQAATFTSLYSQYKLYKIVLKFIPTASQTVTNVTGSGGAALGGMFGTVLDFSGTNVGSTLVNFSDFEQYQNFRYQSALRKKTHVRIFKPVFTYLVSADSGSGLSVTHRDWLSCAYSNVKLFGLRAILEATDQSECSQSYRIQATYYVAFRNVR